VLFDLATRKFYLFGAVFWPQDVIYLAVLLIVSRCRCSCSPRSRVGCGAATPARRPSTPRSSCGSSARSRATGWRASARRVADVARKLVVKTLKHPRLAVALWTGLHVRRLLHADPRRSACA
jgi:polyferredoxin